MDFHSVYNFLYINNILLQKIESDCKSCQCLDNLHFELDSVVIWHLEGKKSELDNKGGYILHRSPITHMHGLGQNTECSLYVYETLDLEKAGAAGKQIYCSWNSCVYMLSCSFLVCPCILVTRMNEH